MLSVATIMLVLVAITLDVMWWDLIIDKKGKILFSLAHGLTVLIVLLYGLFLVFVMLASILYGDAHQFSISEGVVMMGTVYLLSRAAVRPNKLR